MLPQPDPAPPDFARASNPRQKSRAAGLDSDYGYPVEFERKLKRSEAIGEVAA